jgi:hypothetical protein
MVIVMAGRQRQLGYHIMRVSGFLFIFDYWCDTNWRCDCDWRQKAAELYRHVSSLQSAVSRSLPPIQNKQAITAPSSPAPAVRTFMRYVRVCTS